MLVCRIIQQTRQRAWVSDSKTIYEKSIKQETAGASTPAMVDGMEVEPGSLGCLDGRSADDRQRGVFLFSLHLERARGRWMDGWDGQAVVVVVAIEMHCGYGIWDVGGGCASREDDGKKMLS